MTPILRPTIRAALAAAPLLLLLPAPAWAHTGAGPAAGLLHGFLHPLAGADHVLAMLAVGLWAAQRGGSDVWRLPLAFVVAMIAAGAAAMAGFAMPAVETGIVLSVLLLGAIVALTVPLPSAAAIGAVALFALFHGHAHGAEMPAALSAAAYGAGFALATALLHLGGIGFSRVIAGQAPLRRVMAVRVAGACIGAAGLALLLT
jgi:urease accessory protein